ncbi:unnamed protein product [Sphagnum tenellum]
MDESNATCGLCLASIGLENTEVNCQPYRQLLVDTPGLGEYVSGAILFEETLYQSTTDGSKMVDVFVPRGYCSWHQGGQGATDTGLVPLAGSNNESWCQGLDGLASRTAAYYKQGARIAKWRTVISIPSGPSELAVTEAAWGLAQYTAISQPSMVTHGAECPERATPEKVAEYTLTLLKRHVPPSVPGIMFLSGGQSEVEATLNLIAMNQGPNPWHVSFSYARARQTQF